MTRLPSALTPARAALTIIMCGITCGLTGGCETGGQGALTGAGIGALSGLAIGSMTGSAGTGAAVGAIVGGVGGAVVGDQNRRRNEEATQQRTATRAASTPSPPPPPPPPPAQPPTVIVQQPPPTVIVQQAPPPPPASERFQTGPALSQLIGAWAITGTIDSGGSMLPVSGSARSVIDDRYFVSTDLAFFDPRDNQSVTGTIIISQTGGRGLEMTSSFSSHPQVRRYRGEMDATGSVLNFTQTSPSDPSRRIVMRLSPGRVWTADVWNGNQRIESFTFTWIGP